MRSIKTTKSFRKHLKKYQNSQKILAELKKVLFLLQKEKKLPEKYREHQLKGYYADFLECHIFPDVLLLYRFLPEENILLLRDIGSHSELFS